MAEQRNSILEYSKRLGKSIALSAFEVLRDNAPVTTNIIESNTQTVRDSIKKALDVKGLANSVADTLNINYAVKSAKTAFKNLKEDIRTGQFQNSARAEQAEAEAMGLLMKNMLGDDLFDMTEGNMSTEDMSEEEQQAYPVKGVPMVTKGDTVVAATVASETRRATNSITDVLSSISDLDNANRKAIATIQINQNERQALLLTNGFSTLAQGFNSLIEFNNSVMRIHAENTKVFQETMMDLSQQNNAILKEIVEMQRQVYKETAKKKKNPEDELLDDENKDDDNYMDFFKGGFNVKKYMKYVTENAKNNPFIGMISMMIDSFPMIIKDIVANPMQFITKKGIEFAFSSTVKALNRLDSSIENGIQTLLAKIYDYGHSRRAGTITGAIARIFGFKQGEKSFSDIDTSKYNRGAMSWNGIAQKALVEIIPGHLRKIEASLTGQGERVFDYRSGKWTSAKSVRNYEEKMNRAFQEEATAGLKSSMEKLLSPYTKGMNVEDLREMNKQLNLLMKGIYRRGYVDPDDILRNPAKYGNNERVLQMLFKALMSIDRQSITEAIGKISKAKKNKNAIIDQTSFEDQGIQNEIASGAFRQVIGNAKEGNTTLPNGLRIVAPAATMGNLVNIKDSRGMTLYDYQLMIYKETFAIRKILSEYGGTPTGNISTPSGTILPNGQTAGSSFNPFEGFNLDTRSIEQSILNQNRETTQRDTIRKQRVQRREELRRILSDPKFQSASSGRSKEEILKAVQERFQKYLNDNSDYKMRVAGLTARDAFDLKKFLEDDDYANAILKSIEEDKDKYLAKRDLISRDKDYTTDEEGNVIEDDRSFIDKLLEAKTIGDKFNVVYRGFKGIIKAPNRLLTSIIVSADNYIYDFLFKKDTNSKTKDGKQIHGFFEKIIYEAENMFEKVNEKLNEWFKSIKDSNFIGKIKNFLKDNFDIDVDEKVKKLKKGIRDKVAPVGEVLKTGIKNNFREVKEAVLGTAKDVKGAVGSKDKEEKKEETTEIAEGSTEQKQEQATQKQEPQPNAADELLAKLRNATSEEGQFASGAKNVKKGGLAFISEGEAIIPADLNPWNPNRDKVDRKEQSKNESRMKQRFMSKLNSSVGQYAKKIPTHADGIGSFAANLSNDEIAQLFYTIMKPDIDSKKISLSDFRDTLRKQFGIYKMPEFFKDAKVYSEDEVSKMTGGMSLEEAGKALGDYSKNKGKYDRQAKIKDKEKDYRESTGPFTGVNQFLLSAFGRDIDLAVEDVNDFVVKNSPELATGGIGGALLSLVLPLGGPLMGAMVGAITSLLAHNKSFTQYMFGSEMTDPKTGKVITQDGVIPRKIVDSLKKYLPDAKKYGIVGGLAGLIAPFGPVGGIMLGAGASFLKNNQKMQDILFGDESGFLNKDKKAAIRKALPNLGAAVLGSLFLGPFGILGNAILGSGLGLLSTTEQFKRIILGTKDRNGIRRGGLAGAIRRNITDPLKRSMTEMKDQLGNWFRDKILTPVGRGLMPIGKVATSVISAGITNIVNHFRDSVGGFGFDKWFNRIFGGVRRAGGVGKFLAKKVGGIAAFGARQVERAGNRTKLWALQHGFGENLDIQDRIETYGRNKLGHTASAQFDRSLAGMTEQEIEANRDALETLNMVKNGKLDLDIRRKQRDEAVSAMEDDINDMISNSKGGIQYGDVIKYKQRLLDIKSDEDLEKVLADANKDLSYLTPENQKKLQEVLKNSGTRIRKFQKRGEVVKDSKATAKLFQQIKENYGLQNFTDEEVQELLPRFLKYTNAQLDTKHKENKNKLKQLQEEQEGKENPEEVTAENIEKMTDFQKQQLEQQKLMNKNLQALIQIALGNKDYTSLKDTNDIDVLKDKARMTLADNEAEAERARIQGLIKEHQDEIQGDVNKIKTDIFGDKLGRGVDALENLSDEKLMYLLGTDKKKSGKAVTYLRSIAKNYDSTLSKIMNTDKFLDLSENGMKRVTELTLRGYEVKPEDYEDIESLSKYGYKAIIELAKMGVKIDSYKAIDRYFEKYSNGNQKQKSLDALLDFAGVRLKDGNRIANVLTTSEIADNLENDEVRGLRYNNKNTSFQVGINKAIQEGKVPEGLKLNSTAKAESITSKKKSTDVMYDADQAVKDTNLDANIQKTAQVLNDTVQAIYDTNKSVLKTILKASAKLAEKPARGMVPGVDVALDRYKNYKDEKFKQEQSTDPNYRNSIQQAKAQYNDDLDDIEYREQAGQNIKDIAHGFLGVKDEEPKKDEKATNSIEAEKKEPGTHANGLLSQLKDYTLNSVAEKIAPGSTAKFNNKDAKTETPVEQVEKQTPKAQTNTLEEDNNQREMNSIAATARTGLNLTNPAAAMMGSDNGQQQAANTTTLSTSDGEPVQYTKDRQGNLVKIHNKNNVEIEAKQKYKMELQERSTRALELIARGAGKVGGGVISGAKKVTGGLFDMLKGLVTLPMQLIGSIISMIPFAGPLLGLAGKGLLGLGKFLGGKLLTKFATTGLGKTAAGWIGKLGNTRIGNAIAEKFGLNKFKDMVLGTEEQEEDPDSVENKQLDRLTNIDKNIEKLNELMDKVLGRKDTTKEDTETSTSESTSTSDKDSSSTSTKDDTSTSDTSTDTTTDDSKKNDDKKKTEEEKKSEESKKEDSKKDDKQKTEDKKTSTETKPKESDNKQKDSKPKTSGDRTKGNTHGKKKEFFSRARKGLKERLGKIKDSKLIKKGLHTGKTAGKSVGTAIRKYPKGALAAAALGGIGALELTNYGTFTGEGLYQNLRYGVGLDDHAFNADNYDLDLTVDEQRLADNMVKAGKNPDAVAKHFQFIHDQFGEGAGDRNNVYENAADLATTPFSWAWDTLGNAVDNPINNPLTEQLVGLGVQKLTGSAAKGAFANTALETINKYRTGQYDDSSLLGMFGEIGLDYLTNYATAKGYDGIEDYLLNRDEEIDQENEDLDAADNSPEIDQKITEKKNPLDREEYKNLKTDEERKKYIEDHKEEIEEYKRQEENKKNTKPNQDETKPKPRRRTLRERYKSFKGKLKDAYHSERATNFRHNTSQTLRNFPGKVKNRYKQSTANGLLKRLGSGVVSGSKTVGKGLKNILKTKKGKVGAAALIATPLLTGLFDNETSAGTLTRHAAGLGEYETKNQMADAVDTESLLEYNTAEASGVQDKQPTEEESGGILDTLRNSPLASTLISYYASSKGDQIGGAIGEKLFGSKGRVLGELFGGTLGANILDPSEMSITDAIESYGVNRLWDFATGNNEDNEDDTSDSPDVELPDRDKEDKNKDTNENKRSLKDRIKDRASKIKNGTIKLGNKILSVKDGVVQKITDLKTGVSKVVDTAKGIGQGLLNIGKNVKGKVLSLKDELAIKASKIKNGTIKIGQKVFAVKNGIVQTVTDLKTNITDKVTGIKTGLSHMADQAKDTVSSLKDKALSVRNSIRKGASNVANIVKEGAGVAKDKLADMGSALRNNVSELKDKIFNTATGFKDTALSAKDKVFNAASNMKDSMTNMASKASNTVQNVASAAKNTGADAVNAVKNGADEGMLKVQSLIGKVKEGIKSVTSSLGRWINSKGALQAIENFSSRIIESIAKPQNIKRAMTKLARATLSATVAATGIGFAVVTIAGAVSDFIHGYNNADELYHIRPGLATPGMKTVAGFISALIGAIPFLGAFIPEDVVLELAVEYIGPAFGFGKRELDELRKAGDDEANKQQNEAMKNTTFGEDFQSLVKNASSGIISKVVGAADNAANAVADVGKTIANKVGESATVAKNWVADTAKSVGDWISDKASRGWEYLKDKASDAAKTVGEIYDSASSTVKEKYESVKQTIKDHLPSFGSGKHSLYGMSKFYSQLDPEYTMDFNAQGDSIHQTMKDSGCGPAALSNAMSSVGIQVDPRLAAQYALQNGYKETDGGTRPEFFTDMMNKLGTGSNRLHNQDEITNSLKQGQPVILMGKDSRGETKQNPYAENPHYVTATGIDRKGNIIVQDPESYTPNKRYKVSDILNKSTIAIGTGRGKKYGRARNIFYPRILNKVKPKFFGRSGGLGRRYRYGTGNNNVPQIIWDFLTAKGLGSTTVAAIIGNIGVESAGFQLDALSSDGHASYGLCQWTAGRKENLFNLASQMGKDPSDIDVQLAYLWQELTGSHKHALDATVACGDNLEDAVETFCRKFEVPDMRYAHLDRRNEYARQAFETQGKGVATSGTYTPGGAGNSGGTQQKKNGGLFGAIANVSSILSAALNPFGTASASDTKPDLTTNTQQDGDKANSNTESMANYGKEEGKEIYATKDEKGNTVIKTETADNALGVNNKVSNEQIAKDALTGGKEFKIDITKTGSGRRSLKSRYGRLKHFMFGRGDEETPTTTEQQPSTTNANMTAEEAKQANNEATNAKTDIQNQQNTTTSTSSSSGGLFNGIESFAKQVASPLSKVMGKFGGVLKSGISAVFGDKIKFLFGDDNPFLSIFGAESSSNKPGSNAGPGQTMNVKVAGNPVDTLLGSMSGAVVTSDFGATDGRPTAGAHGGVDIGADAGTPIPSPISGVVYELGSGDGGGYGHYVQVKDNQGNYHMFAHCDQQMVQVGQQVSPGTVLATVGDTGNSYGAHLHYQIDPPENVGAVKDGAHLNPNSYTGTGKHFNSLSHTIMPKFGRGMFDNLSKTNYNDTFEGIDSLNIENSASDDILSTQSMEPVKLRDEGIKYDGFQTDKVPKYGTGWFSDFTKRSINTIRDTFDRWFGTDNKEEGKTNADTTATSTNTSVPSKQPTSVPKDSNTSDTTSQSTTTTTAQTTTPTTDANVHKVTDSQKLDAILDAMNENNRLIKQQNQLLSSIINIASNYINSNVVTIDKTKQELPMNTNTRRNNYDLTTTNLKAQLSQIGNGSQFGLGDRFGTRDSDGFSDIIRTMNEVATR